MGSSFYFELLYVMLLSIAVGAVTMTLSKSKIFLPIREIIKERSEFLGDLINCTYCTSHWIAAAFVILFQPSLMDAAFQNFMLCWLLLVALASGTVWFIFKTHSVTRPMYEED